MNADKVARSLLSLLALWSALLVEGCGGGSSGGTANVSTYAIGGTVSGLTTGNSVVLKDNNADDLTVSANAAFTFGTAVANGGSYSVTVSMQPNGQTCLVSDGAGIVATANVTQIRVLCPSETVMWTFAPSGLYGSG